MKNYIVEADFEHKGLRCVVIMLNRGYRCGYVGVEAKHPLYGKDYNYKIGSFDDIADQSLEKRSPIGIALASFEFSETSPVRISFYFNVHGGITYAGGDGAYPVESDLWWFGYDCTHAGDANDLSVMSGTAKEIEIKYRSYGVVRSLEYCIDECKSLAEQLSKFSV